MKENRHKQEKQIKEQLVRMDRVTRKKMLDYPKALVSVSGGKDSTVMAYLIREHDVLGQAVYAFVDTGLEMAVTKIQIKRMETELGIRIHTIHPDKKVPRVVKEQGQPFLSKQVSEFISRLQKHGFRWEDEPLDVLLDRYCDCMDDGSYTGCVSALEWWCNAKGDYGENSRFSIAYNKGLKEFMVLYPPYFDIANKCCITSKEGPLHSYAKELKCDMEVIGVRRSEGGARSTAHKNCFTKETERNTVASYRPLYYTENEAMNSYIRDHQVILSDFYTIYGMKRSGCCGCPYGKHLLEELAYAKEHEPALYRLATELFADSYLYTKMYEAFRADGIVPDELISEYEIRKTECCFQKCLKEIYTDEEIAYGIKNKPLEDKLKKEFIRTGRITRYRILYPGKQMELSDLL